MSLPRSSAFALLLLAGCFPELPDEQIVNNLRVLSVRSDPATVAIAFPPPKIKVEALVALPEDPSGRTLTHRWSLELGDEDFEGREQLEALLPSGPQSNAITVDFAQFFAEREGGWLPAVLPLKYRVESADDHREAIKLVSFLTPDPAAFGDDDDSAEPSEPLEILPPEETAAWNSNPEIVSLVVNASVVSQELGNLPGPDSPLYVGDVSREDGLEVTFELRDAEQAVTDLRPRLFWSGGTAGLPVEEEEDPFGGAFGEQEEEEDDGNAQFGSGPSPFLTDTSFGWTPPESVDETVRLWFVVEDGAGGATWQEIRLGEPPVRTF
jgi:hypothetical protein